MPHILQALRHPFNTRRVNQLVASGGGLVLDSAYPQWTIPSLKAAHVVAVSRYLAPDRNGQRNPKCISPSELALYLGNGIRVCFNWESTGHTWRGGYNAGLTEGQEARLQMRRLGLPDSVIVTHSIDEPVAYSEVPKAFAWMDGVDHGHHTGEHQGCYATFPVLDALHRGGYTYLWQTNARKWTGNNLDYPYATMYQHGQSGVSGIPAGTYDWNSVRVGVTDFGQYPPPSKPPPPPPPPVEPIIEEAEDMALVRGDAPPGQGNDTFPFVGNSAAVWRHVWTSDGPAIAHVADRAWALSQTVTVVSQSQIDRCVKLEQDAYTALVSAGKVG